MRNQKKQIEKDCPNLLEALQASEEAYKEYLDKVAALVTERSQDSQKRKNPYENVRPQSPGWQTLRNKHKPPEHLKVMMEQSVVKEIPETTPILRLYSQIPIKHEIDREKIRKEFKSVFAHKTTESSDSEYESKNLQLWLKKNRDKT